MKAILLQLPIQGHDFFYSNENIPLAAACLQAIGTNQGVEVKLLPNPLMSYGSDRSIIDDLVETEPDMVGMSCYLWNLERSLYVAQQIKKSLPRCRVVLGGPEVTPDNAFLLRHDGFDVGVVGEGEKIWEILLRSFPALPQLPGLLLRGPRGEWQFNGGLPIPPSLNGCPSPYLLGRLDSHVNRVLWLETVRGCVHHCAYCYYHKQYGKLRSFPSRRILEEVQRAIDRELEEVVFLDPCFTKRPQLRYLLEGLAAVNRNHRLHFHGECNGEDVDSGAAEELERAGFRQMEVGLQTVNERTLNGIQRHYQFDRLLEGLRCLRRRNIEVTVDVIAGLPGDGPADICRSLDWVLEHDAYDVLMMYPLSLLPGTELHRRSTELGLTAMPHPPYLLTRSRDLDARGMRESFRSYGKRMGEDVSSLEVPYGLDTRTKPYEVPSGFTHFIRWGEPEDVTPLVSQSCRTTYALTVSLSKAVLAKQESWHRVLCEYLTQNPFTLLSIEVPADSTTEERAPLWQIARERSHPVDRDYTVVHSPYRSFLVLSRADHLMWKWPDPRESGTVDLPDGQGVSFRPTACVLSPDGRVPPWLVDHLTGQCGREVEALLWEPPENETEVRENRRVAHDLVGEKEGNDADYPQKENLVGRGP